MNRKQQQQQQKKKHHGRTDMYWFSLTLFLSYQFPVFELKWSLDMNHQFQIYIKVMIFLKDVPLNTYKMTET